MLKSQPELLQFLKVGELVEVRLLEKAKQGVFFDVRGIATGTLYGRELANARDIVKSLKPGDTIKAKIIELENEGGFVELSLSEADKQKSWEDVKEIQEKNEPISIKITEVNAGGLMGEIAGIRAFLPVSQLSNEHYPRVADGDRAKILEELKKFVGEELTVKVININSRVNKLIVSEREVVSQGVKELIKKYNVGDVIDGIISGVASFGAFIRFANVPELEGLIHISELGHRLIDNPKEVVTVGDMVKAKIVDIKEDRISLSLKALQEDPWQKVEERYKAGEEITGVVHKFNPFGAFIKLDVDITGLIHVSEFGSVDEMKKEMDVGKSYTFKIDSVKPAEKRLVLKRIGNQKKEIGETNEKPV
ncbi:MAG: hypothetical protein A3H06_00800 [Candidatus Colwellbacteria bacterium RIFCSPLOWO2_12_FULL_44_13]|uniref:S1 motif domain-containing protein n=1 Tax=Candidatus Colwellbacteria bacterium RIFCSPLOWO2_12_FULL_44_13 TaxID=1797694 RepID=A0A1G1Z9T0_9BACT|nr:MAG: hypothetical protein A3H06_00800 [Candidatus Colwellbacteria bacterium RIFCSPLOWO2_12_FULL_44_13]